MKSLTFIATVCLLAACANVPTSNAVLLNQEAERTTHYLRDSIKQSDEGLRTVTLEVRDSKPEQGAASLIRQQAIIDCTHKLVQITRVELFDAQGKSMGNEESEYADLNTWTAEEIQQATRTQSNEFNSLTQQVCLKK